MPTGFDHIVIAVNDLDDATTDYARAGFTVTPGGEHTSGVTHNALVAFADGSYIELIAWKAPAPDTAWYRRLESGEGLIDFALRTDDLDAEVARLRATGLNVPEPEAGGRTRPDGQRIEWRNLRFGGNVSPAMPFYCHSTNDRRLRVPSGDAAVHPNGVVGIDGVSVLVRDLDAAARDFARLTGKGLVDEVAVAAPVEDAARFPVGGGWIHVIAPEDVASIAAAALMSRGELAYEVTLRVGGETQLEHELLPLDLTHGARLLLTTGD